LFNGTSKASEKRRCSFSYGEFSFWGGSTALAITLFNWYTTHRVETFYEVVGRFVAFMAGGILYGLFLWDRSKAQGGRKTDSNRTCYCDSWSSSA
jgi:hypothetical protein